MQTISLDNKNSLIKRCIINGTFQALKAMKRVASTLKAGDAMK